MNEVKQFLEAFEAWLLDDDDNEITDTTIKMNAK